MAASTAIFQLGPLPDLDATPFTYIDLPEIQPAWDLPPLDENAAGSDRLLRSLQDTTGGSAPATPSRKGKEREEPVANPVGAPPDTARASKLDWARMVGGSEGNGGSGTTFEVSRDEPCQHV